MKRFSFWLWCLPLVFTLSSCLTTDDSSLTSDEIVAGLKEALKVGTNNSVTTLNRTDGYFADAALKILLPPEAAAVEAQMRSFGLGGYVDDVILKMNRAAEDAARKAGPIFINAVTNMTVTDGLSILNGVDTAATQYLRRNTAAQLTVAYKPDIETALQSVGAQQAWSTLVTNYNRIPLVDDINPDLSAHVTTRALEGLFLTIGKEEQKIRRDPLARVTDILKKVFGSRS